LADTSSLVVRGEVDHTLNENVLEFNTFDNRIRTFTESLITQVYQNLLDQANIGVQSYQSMREDYFKQIEEEQRRKRDEIERKAYEKKRKEIERQRNIKLYTIKNSIESSGINSEIETSGLMDVNDQQLGFYCFGGALGEIPLMLIHMKNK